MPLNTKMELHDTSISTLAEIKAISPVILSEVTANTLPMKFVKWLEFLVDNIGLVDRFSNKWLAFLCEQTVSHYWLTCFSIPKKISF